MCVALTLLLCVCRGSGGWQRKAAAGGAGGQELARSAPGPRAVTSIYPATLPLPLILRIPHRSFIFPLQRITLETDLRDSEAARRATDMDVAALRTERDALHVARADLQQQVQCLEMELLAAQRQAAAATEQGTPFVAYTCVLIADVCVVCAVSIAQDERDAMRVQLEQARDAMRAAAGDTAASRMQRDLAVQVHTPHHLCRAYQPTKCALTRCVNLRWAGCGPYEGAAAVCGRQVAGRAGLGRHSTRGDGARSSRGRMYLPSQNLFFCVYAGLIVLVPVACFLLLRCSTAYPSCAVEPLRRALLPTRWRCSWLSNGRPYSDWRSSETVRIVCNTLFACRLPFICVCL